MNEQPTHSNQHLASSIEGLLFALGKPLSYVDLQKILHVSLDEIMATLTPMRSQQGRGVVIVDDGSRVELRIAPDVAPLVEEVRREENIRDIGRAGLEVLAATLYRGPLTRAEVDFIRGVHSSQTLRTLTTRGLVRRIQNPKDERSFLYEATTEVLSTMGATHPRDLPDFDETRGKLAALEEAYRKQLHD